MTCVAFLGTGMMGFPMARNLARAGFEVRAWNRSVNRVRALADEGAQICRDPREAAEGAELVITMLTDANAVLDTASRAFESAPAGTVWAQMSTIGLEGLDSCRALAERAGVTLVDAPVLGTREPAEQGKLIVLASGPEAALEACRPIFEVLGSRTLTVGEAGAGTRHKLVLNSWVLGVTGLLAETISLAQALELDPHQFFEAVKDGPLDLPYAKLKGEAMIERSFGEVAFRLSLAHKDGDLVLSAAEQAQLETPVLNAVVERLARADDAGHGDEDMAATYWATAPEDRTAGAARPS